MPGGPVAQPFHYRAACEGYGPPALAGGEAGEQPPSFHQTDWELSGIIALLLEAIVVGAAVWRSRAVEHSRASSFA